MIKWARNRLKSYSKEWKDSWGAFKRSLEYEPKSRSSVSQKLADSVDEVISTTSIKTSWVFGFAIIVALLAPLIVVLELAFALLVVGSIFAAPISLGMIANGKVGWEVYLIAVISTTTLLLRYIIIPLLKRSKKLRRLNNRYL